VETFLLTDLSIEKDRTPGWHVVKDAGEVFQMGDGTWVLTSTDAVRFACRHPEIFSSAEAFRTAGVPVPLVPVAIDPPDHTKYRRVLDPLLSPRVVNAMEDRLRAQVRDLVAAFASTGRCDVVTDIAKLYPTQVFVTLFGLPLADRDQLVRWVEICNEHSTHGTADPNPTVVEAAMAMFRYVQHFIDEKRQNPGDDVLSTVLALKGDEAWSNEEVLGLIWLVLVAGLDTVTGAIGFTMLYLARNRDLRRKLVADPGLIPPFIEEVLRIEPPAPTTSRVTTQEVELCGVRIPAGAPVMLCLAAANRDPEKFEHPDDIDTAQKERGHLTFGGGIHRCLGAHLARRELRLVVEEFHKQIPEYEIAPGFEPEVVWPSATLHLRSLPLVFPVPGGAS